MTKSKIFGFLLFNLAVTLFTSPLFYLSICKIALYSKGDIARDTTAHRWQSKSHSNEERKDGSCRRAPKSETIHAAHLSDRRV